MTTRDYVDIGVLLGSLLLTWLQASKLRLPKRVRAWVNRVGLDDLVRFVEQAERYAGQTSEEKRLYVKALIIKKLHAQWPNIPESILNMLVEYAYQVWRTRKR